MQRLRHATAGAGFLLLFSASAQGAECIGVTMPDSVTVADETLVLNGMGARKATAFRVKVYAAGLYLTDRMTDAETIITKDQPRHLVLQFVRDVDKDEISKAWVEGFEKNAGATLGALQDRIATLNSYMTDFNAGDTLTFSYLPSKGTEVIIDGTSKGTIPGPNFGAVLIAIWLRDPPNEALKVGLLGGKCD